MLSFSVAQCTHHHTCEIGQRLSQHERESGLLRLGLPPSRDPTPPVMDNILQEVTAIRHFLEKRDRCREVAKEWLQVGYVLDVLLFRVYLVAVVTYSITLGTLWSVWQVAWGSAHRCSKLRSAFQHSYWLYCRSVDAQMERDNSWRETEKWTNQWDKLSTQTTQTLFLLST